MTRVGKLIEAGTSIAPDPMVLINPYHSLGPVYSLGKYRARTDSDERCIRNKQRRKEKRNRIARASRRRNRK